VIRTIKQLIESPERRAQSLSVGEHLLPYLVNRHPQMRPICRTVYQKSSASGEHPKTRPSLFVIPCRHYDVTDKFSWRLTSKDGPEYSGFDPGRDTPDWVKEEAIFWPAGSTPRDFAESFKSYNEHAVSKALKQSKSRGRPVCFSTWIDTTAIEKQFGAFIREWIQSWPDLLAEASKKIVPENVRLRSQPPIVVLLFLRFESKRDWLSRWFTHDASRVAQYCNELQKLETEAAYSRNVDFRSLEPLALITRNDADTWLTWTRWRTTAHSINGPPPPLVTCLRDQAPEFQ
jgi:hypothetical protein